MLRYKIYTHLWRWRWWRRQQRRQRWLSSAKVSHQRSADVLLTVKPYPITKAWPIVINQEHSWLAIPTEEKHFRMESGVNDQHEMQYYSENHCLQHRNCVPLRYHISRFAIHLSVSTSLIIVPRSLRKHNPKANSDLPVYVLVCIKMESIAPFSDNELQILMWRRLTCLLLTHPLYISFHWNRTNITYNMIAFVTNNEWM